MELKKYLNEPKNSVIREKIGNYKFFYDVKVAAAKNNNDIQLYSPEIDSKGFDVMLDDGDYLKAIQLKTFIKGSKTQSWEIHKRLLRTSPNFADELSPSHVGLNGGVVLLEFNLNDFDSEISSIDYYYFDYLTLMYQVLINNNAECSKIKSELNKMDSRKISIKKNVFLKVKNIESLLVLLGLHSPVTIDLYSSWNYYFKNRHTSENTLDDLKKDYEKLIIIT